MIVRARDDVGKGIRITLLPLAPVLCYPIYSQASSLTVVAEQNMILSIGVSNMRAVGNLLLDEG